VHWQNDICVLFTDVRSKSLTRVMFITLTALTVRPVVLVVI